LQTGQTPSCRNGFPEGAIPCSRLSLLVLRIPDLEPTTDHSTRVAVVGPPLGPLNGSRRSKTGPGGNAGPGGAQRSCFARSSGRAQPSSGRDTELHRMAARPSVPPHVGSHDAPRRVAPPQAPRQSSGARIGQPVRVHPGTWRHVRSHLRVTPIRPPRKWLRGRPGLLPPTPVRKDGRGAGTPRPPSPPVGADARMDGFQQGILHERSRQRQEGTRPREGYGSPG
jgi:hypothetical protein